ncbi:MAG TPA: hypothetical protein VNL18_06910, partial [Gemmatimonadales bacterium]|nr:hypothetical protein [Gemmatimonadales bacterium]
AQGRAVTAAGIGAPVPGATGTLLALKVAFAPPLERFDGTVASVDLDAASVTLDDGTVVRVPEGSMHHELGDREVLTTLADVAESLAAGKKVLAAGLGLVESRDPLTLVAARVVFFVAPPPLQRFEGIVQLVDLERRSVTLKSGAVIRVPEGAIHRESGDGNTLHSLADVAAAIAAGKTVLAVGVGTVETAEPLVIVAVKVMFVAQPPGLIRFDGIVTAVNLEAGSVTLKSGAVVRVTEETTIHGDAGTHHMLGSLNEIAEALRDGKTVSIVGVGEVESHDPLVIVAHDVAFLVKPPVFVFFTGTVASVNLDTRRLQLEDGTAVMITERTEIAVDEHTLPSLRAVAEALEAGRTVVAAGVGIPLAGEGDAYEAVKIVFVVSS